MTEKMVVEKPTIDLKAVKLTPNAKYIMTVAGCDTEPERRECFAGIEAALKKLELEKDNISIAVVFGKVEVIDQRLINDPAARC